MNDILELYNNIYKKIDIINSQIRDAESNLKDMRAARRDDIPARIKHLEETIEKVDEYVLRVKGFQEIAKRNLQSQNVLTIEAPPGYRVNLNRLKNWAVMIDPQSDNDPYAQRVLAVAKCDECFLEQKRVEFKNRIEELRNDDMSGLTDEMADIERQVDKLKKQRNTFINDVELKQLADKLSEEHEKYEFKTIPSSFSNPQQAAVDYAIGSYDLPLGFGDDLKEELQEMFGEHYVAETGGILLPVILPFDKESVIAITCSPSKTKLLDLAIQNLLLSQIELSPAGTRKIFIADGVRYNTSSVGVLRKMEGSFALEQIPRNPEQLTGLLEQIVSSFGDIDEIIDLNDSIREYNQQIKDKTPLPYSTLVLFGWPNSFSSRDKELISRILSNYERYGISVVMVNYSINDSKEAFDSRDIPEYALYNAINIRTNNSGSAVSITADDEDNAFKWYLLDQEIPDSYLESITKTEVGTSSLGNDYLVRHDMKTLPNYTRGYKPIVLPFGVDGKDQEQSISFDNNNFAAYLIGDSGSGKSTLIHTIIAGILRDYHPDDVELWLADYKQVEFKQYIDHMPPHVKYILLDESNELVYDLIDKLNDEMLARQQLLARLGKEKIEEINIRDLGKPVPVIFVILDEFSIMSQAIEEDQSYRLKLQNLLAKGRALGFKFLFASQKFTSGVRGLTPTAKDQIQQRISMKAPKEEINEVLALSPALRTEKVRNWIDAIPPYYALVKRRIDDDTLEVSRNKVMYFSDDYESRDLLIDGINNKMKSVTEFDYADVNSYVEKNPVIVDGNSYEAFDLSLIKKSIASVDKDSEDILLSFGAPRLMSRVKTALLTNETRENVLLVGRTSEQECEASVIFSILKMAKDQGKLVSVWSYDRNRLYKQYSEMFKSEEIRTVVGMTDICKEIKALKESVQSGVYSNQVIVMLGMERICSDFEYNDGFTKNSKFEHSRTPEEEKEVRLHHFNMKMMEKRNELIKTSKAEGKSDEEIKSLVEDLIKKMKSEFENNEPKSSDDAVSKQEKNTQHTDVYDAGDDFSSIVRGGSRFGYHFVLCLNSMSDFKATKLKIEYFRHKIAFQLSEDDSYTVFGKKIASKLPEHTCLYDDSFYRYSLRPYLHKGICWDGWDVNDNNKPINPMEVQL